MDDDNRFAGEPSRFGVNRAVNQAQPDRVGCTPEFGPGSGSGSEQWICTPDKAFVALPQSCYKTLLQPPLTPSLQPSRRPSPITLLNSPSPSPLRIATPSLVLTPATALFSTDDEDMPVHQPRPQHPTTAQPSESSTSHLRPAPPSRPPSRSEKLLREALLRDQERPPMPHSPYTSTTPASPSSVAAGRSPTRHRRRHSEIPTGAPSQQRRYEMEEEYARGAMMFRSPVVSTSPRAPSPCDGAPALSRRHSQSQRSQPHTQAAAAAPSRTSQSPSRSPVLARRSSMRSERSATTTTGISRSRVPHPLPLHDDHPHYAPPMMTPHEQVLRARLERVLASAPSPKRASASAYGDDWRREDTSPTAADDERESYVSTSTSSGSAEEDDENVVRDENGKARVWRGCNAKARPPAMLATPSSSGSGSARSTSQDGRFGRSHTEPILPAMLHQLPSSPYHHQQQQHSGYASPRKSATAPSMAGHRSYYRPHHHHPRSGTTPPLMSDGSPTPPEEEDEEDSPEEEDLKLLTPPATPPTIPAGYHPNNYYAPSPYFNKQFQHQQSMHLVPVTSAGAERRGRTLVGRGRPPMRDVPTFDDSEDEDEDGYQYSDDEYAPHPHQHHQYHHTTPPPMPPNAYGPSIRQQQFNARRASAKAREMEGYVSFSAVEGLGAPPESELSSEEEQKEAMRRRKGADAKGGVVGGWVRRLWGSESGQGGQQGVVV